MVDKLPIQGRLSSHETGAAQPSKPLAPGKTEPQGGPAFRALLDKLQAEARDLQRESETVEAAADLSDAVERARSSLGEALTLGDQLLEAYREAKQRGDQPAAAPPSDGESESKPGG